jgi:hypothetical protein
MMWYEYIDYGDIIVTNQVYDVQNTLDALLDYLLETAPYGIEVTAISNLECIASYTRHDGSEFIVKYKLEECDEKI